MMLQRAVCVFILQHLWGGGEGRFLYWFRGFAYGIEMGLWDGGIWTGWAGFGLDAIDDTT
jgi:hypothetical protein